MCYTLSMSTKKQKKSAKQTKPAADDTPKWVKKAQAKATHKAKSASKSAATDTKTAKSAKTKAKMHPAEAIFCMATVAELLFCLFNILHVLNPQTTEYRIAVALTIFNAIMLAIVATRKGLKQAKFFPTAMAFFFNTVILLLMPLLADHNNFLFAGKFSTVITWAVIISAFDALFLYIARHHRYVFVAISSVIYTILACGNLFDGSFEHIANGITSLIGLVVIPLIINELIIRLGKK